MAFLPFGIKLELAKEYSFEEIPIFSSLSSSEQKLIEKKARLVEFKRGDIIYAEGTPSDAFYVVISGRFRLFTKARFGEEETLIYFYRGDHFGETSLLTSSLHSGTVEAKRDGVILRLEKEDFLRLIKEIPALSLHLSRSLGHRLTKGEDMARRREVKIAALYSVSHPPKVLPFWLDFAAMLFRETKRKVILVDFVAPQSGELAAEFHRSSIPVFDLNTKDPSKDTDLRVATSEHPKGFFYLNVQAEEEFEKYEKKLSTLLTTLTYRYDYIFLRLPLALSHPSFKALKQSDQVYAYTNSDVHELSESAEALAEFQKNFGFGKSELKAIVAEAPGKEALSFEGKEKIINAKIFTTLPSLERNAERYQGTLRFLAKELAGTLVGLALGSGAAFGLAHIGVLKVLEKEGIAIDVISGSSIGAFIGAFWASGYSAAQLETIACSLSNKKSAFLKLLGLRDISAAHRGFFKGNQITRFMESYFEGRTFQDLRIPLKVVATNFYTSEAIVLESGSVADAVRASISIPAIFRPVFYQKHCLIDGGIADPLPIRVLNSMGVKKIIAVNVLAGPKDLNERKRLYEESRQQWLEAMEKKNFFSRMISQLLRKVHHRYAVNVFNMIMNSIQYMEYELAESWGKQADVLIHPIVPDGHWAEFYHAEKFIRMGERRTLEQLAEIRHLLVE